MGDVGSRLWPGDQDENLRPVLVLPPRSRVVVVSSGADINGSPASGGYAGSKATQRFIAGYAQDESRRARAGHYRHGGDTQDDSVRRRGQRKGNRDGLISSSSVTLNNDLRKDCDSRNHSKRRLDLACSPGSGNFRAEKSRTEKLPRNALHGNWRRSSVSRQS
jgi:hypothetical protein